jgi:hypothetical protein
MDVTEDDGETYNVERSGPFPSSSDPRCDVENEDDPHHTTCDRYDDKGECILNSNKFVKTIIVFRISDIETCSEEPPWCFSSTSRASLASSTASLSVIVYTAGYEYSQILKFLTASPQYAHIDNELASDVHQIRNLEML